MVALVLHDLHIPYAILFLSCRLERKTIDSQREKGFPLGKGLDNRLPLFFVVGDSGLGSIRSNSFGAFLRQSCSVSSVHGRLIPPSWLPVLVPLRFVYLPRGRLPCGTIEIDISVGRHMFHHPQLLFPWRL